MKTKVLEGRIKHNFATDNFTLKTKEGALYTLPPIIDEMITDISKHNIKITITVEQS